MTITLIFSGAALLLIIGLRYAVVGAAAQITNPEELLHRTKPVDLAAFRNLMNPEDDIYLRTYLPWTSYVRVEFARRRAAIEYVHAVAHNAAILIRLAQASKASSIPTVSECGSGLLSLALEARILAVLALAQLYISLVLPWWQPSLGSAAFAYAELRQKLQTILMLQRPELATRISSGI